MKRQDKTDFNDISEEIEEKKINSKIKKINFLNDETKRKIYITLLGIMESGKNINNAIDIYIEYYKKMNQEKNNQQIKNQLDSTIFILDFIKEHINSEEDIFKKAIILNAETNNKEESLLLANLTNENSINNQNILKRIIQIIELK